MKQFQDYKLRLRQKKNIKDYGKSTVIIINENVIWHYDTHATKLLESNGCPMPNASKKGQFLVPQVNEVINRYLRNSHFHINWYQNVHEKLDKSEKWWKKNQTERKGSNWMFIYILKEYDTIRMNMIRVPTANSETKPYD